MRDTFADEDHFLRFIEDLAAVEVAGLQGLADGRIRERRPGRARLRYWTNRLDVLESGYSVGLPIPDLARDFGHLVAAVPNLEAFDTSSATGFDKAVTLSSWAVLLDDSRSATTIASILERDKKFVSRVVPLLNYFDLEPSRPEAEEPLDDYGVYEARDAQLGGDGAQAAKLLYQFVNEQWFQWTYNSGFRVITHTGKKIGHVGYWCYEAAAFAKVFGIDDSRLEGHKHYPWDLAHP